MIDVGRGNGTQTRCLAQSSTPIRRGSVPSGPARVRQVPDAGIAVTIVLKRVVGFHPTCGDGGSVTDSVGNVLERRRRGPGRRDRCAPEPGCVRFVAGERR
jgi:hypothetical protein